MATQDVYARSLYEAVSDSPILNAILHTPANDRHDVVDGGELLLLLEDAACLWGSRHAAVNALATECRQLHNQSNATESKGGGTNELQTVTHASTAAVPA